MSAVVDRRYRGDAWTRDLFAEDFLDVADFALNFAAGLFRGAAILHVAVAGRLPCFLFYLAGRIFFSDNPIDIFIILYASPECTEHTIQVLRGKHDYNKLYDSPKNNPRG